jgi:alpha-1,6-mannosyltransferase
MRLAALVSPPYLSTDIYRYVWDGRVEAAGINPYRYIPTDPHLLPLRDRRIFPHINRNTYAPTIYPPVAEAIYFAATRLANSLAGMKAAMVAIEAGGILILLRLLAASSLPRERILAYAWHPLTVWEFAGSGHIDAAVVAFVALALWWRRRGAAGAAGIALAGAALVKFFPAVILPALYRRWDWRMPSAFVAALLLAYAPYIGVGAAVLGFLPGYAGEEGFGSGAGFYLWNLAEILLPITPTSPWPYLALVALFLGAIALAALFDDDRREDRFIVWAAILASAFTVLLSPHYAWYFAWLVLFLCFLRSLALLCLTAGSFVLYLIPVGSRLIVDRRRLLVESALYGLVAVVAALELWRRRFQPLAQSLDKEASDGRPSRHSPIA